MDGETKDERSLFEQSMQRLETEVGKMYKQNLDKSRGLDDLGRRLNVVADQLKEIRATEVKRILTQMKVDKALMWHKLIAQTPADFIIFTSPNDFEELRAHWCVPQADVPSYIN